MEGSLNLELLLQNIVCPKCQQGTAYMNSNLTEASFDLYADSTVRLRFQSKCSKCEHVFEVKLDGDFNFRSLTQDTRPPSGGAA